MRKRCISFWFLILALCLNIGSVLAQDREILYSKSPSGDLEKMAGIIQNLDSEKVPYADLIRKSDYFVRIAPRAHILTENNEVKDNAILGTKPFVFVTTPESVYGKSLLDIYLDIGYEAEDIIRWQRDQDMVAIVFRYPADITVSASRDGQLPDDWEKHVYVPTWENIFSLFHRLAANASIEPDKKGEFAPVRSFFRSKGEQDFVLGFPEDGKKRLKKVNYANLKAVGGADWTYRDLLEKKLSVFEHFRGNGRTLNEIVDPEGVHSDAGLLEFVGPNRKITELPELAIIYLGRLTMEDIYTPLTSNLSWDGKEYGIPRYAVLAQ